MDLYNYKDNSYTSLRKLCEEHGLNYMHIYRKIKKHGEYRNANNTIVITITKLVKRDD